MPYFSFAFMTKIEACGVRLVHHILDQHFMKAFLMLNYTLMKYCIHFSLINSAEEEFCYFMQDGGSPHAVKQSKHYIEFLEN
jgi:hypothetical protein